MDTSPASVLLAVVEVPFENRIRCCAEGCGHSVYKRVHVVRQAGAIQLFGSDCFARLFGGEVWAHSGPRYGSGEGRLLTPEERALLGENTERLIEQFEREVASQPSSPPTDLNSAASKNPVERTRPPEPVAAPPAPPVSRLRRAEAEAIARERLSRRYAGINLNMPGWVGLVAYETEDVLREYAA